MFYIWIFVIQYLSIGFVYAIINSPKFKDAKEFLDAYNRRDSSELHVKVWMAALFSIQCFFWPIIVLFQKES